MGMPNYAKLLLLARQLPLRDAFRVGCTEIARWLLDRHKTVSYAQNGEDLIIDGLLRPGASGRYVDVGCNHPIQRSNTYRLYQRGWTGLAIDANLAFATEFAKLRPNDRFINVCVSDLETDATLRIYRDHLLSSLGSKKAFDSPTQYALESEQTVRTRTLNDILASCNFAPQFELLSIDAEFHDLEVLRSIDLALYKPELIVIEAHDARADDLYSHPIYKYARQNGYGLGAFYASSFFFTRLTNPPG
jgi:FkbM family methyltransferase